MARYSGGYSKGRERSFHFGSVEHHIVGMIFIQISIVNSRHWCCFAHKLWEKSFSSFTGEGGTSQGEFHEVLM